MKKIQLVKQYISKPLLEHGFVYYKSTPYTWIFIRKKEEIEQYINISESNYSKGIRLELYTSTNPGNIIEIRDFYPEWDQKTFFWIYKEEEEFIAILKYFFRLLDQYGIRYLDENSGSSDDEISEELFWKLYIEKDCLCQNFIEKNKQDITKINQGLDCIIKLMKELKDYEYKDITDVLIEMAAYYGNAINNEFNGVWKWDETLKNSYIELKFGKLIIEVYPLKDIAVTFEYIKETDDYLYECYDQLHEYKNY